MLRSSLRHTSLAAGCLLLFACGTNATQPKQPDRIQASPEQEAAWRALVDDEAIVARGADLYEGLSANCVHCHGRDGLGLYGLGPNLRDDYWIYGSDIAEIIESIGYGRNRGRMPGLKPRVPDEDIHAIAAYIAHWNKTEKANDEGYRMEAVEQLDPIDY